MCSPVRNVTRNECRSSNSYTRDTISSSSSIKCCSTRKSAYLKKTTMWSAASIIKQSEWGVECPCTRWRRGKKVSGYLATTMDYDLMWNTHQNPVQEEQYHFYKGDEETINPGLHTQSHLLFISLQQILGPSVSSSSVHAALIGSSGPKFQPLTLLTQSCRDIDMRC